MLTKRQVALLVVTLAGAGCNQQDQHSVRRLPPGGPREQQAEVLPFPKDVRPIVDYSAFSIEFEMPQSIRRRQAIPLRLAVRNTSDKWVWLETGDSTYTFNFIVTDQNGTEVWNRLWHRREEPVPMILKQKPMPPGQTTRFSDVWNQRDNRGKRVPPGVYFVRGTLDTQQSIDTEEDMKTSAQRLVLR